jgi:hypothetical protein
MNGHPVYHTKEMICIVGVESTIHFTVHEYSTIKCIVHENKI